MLSGLPIWNFGAVQRKFILKNPMKDWKYRQKQLIGVVDWRSNRNFMSALTNLYVCKSEFVIAVKLENLVAIGDGTQLDMFRRQFKHAFIWTIITGRAEKPSSVSEDELFISELDFDSDTMIDTKPLRLVFEIVSKYK